MFGLSLEHLIILGIILLIFGPRRLPELGMTLGKAMRNFKDSINGIQEPEFRKLSEKATTEKPPTEPDVTQSQNTASSQTQNQQEPPISPTT